MAPKLWIRKVRIEHKTCVISIPAEAMALLGIRPGGYVRLELGVVAGGVVLKSADGYASEVLQEVGE